jgi:hypothetical protein
VECFCKALLSAFLRLKDFPMVTRNVSTEGTSRIVERQYRGEVLTSCRCAVRRTIGYFPLERCLKPQRLGLRLHNYLKS